MALTADQKKGLDIILDRWKQGKRYTVLSGFAGTGKSYLIHHVISAMGLDPESEVAYATPTGKAALVLQSMGNKNAQTIHRLLYRWYKDASGSWRRYKLEELPYKLVVCDEVGMVSGTMINDLLSHKETHVIFSGDPAQLPPVDKQDANDLLDNPHVFLTEIMRQALESDIVKISMDIREGKSLEYFKGHDAQIIDSLEMRPAIYLWADQVICATNRKRQEINQIINTLKGFPNDQIVDGQKIICLHNNWDVVSDIGEPIVNGTIGIARNPREEVLKVHPWCGEWQVDCVRLDLETEGSGTFHDIIFDKQQLLGGEATITDWKEIKYIKNWYKRKYALEHNLHNPLDELLEGQLGWAITCHKAQGSTFGKVFVEEERFPFSQEEHKRWLYTAVTRPSSRLVVLKNNGGII